MNAESKVTAEHLKRRAYLYIRQSTLRQVLENTESTQRQYALRRRALALGWPEERIIVIDHDQGQSGASAVDREGFQRLVTEVGLGKAGIVMGLEVSRLARNCADWHRLLEICALTHTLILDEDGLYDPGHFNDRLAAGAQRHDERGGTARAQGAPGGRGDQQGPTCRVESAVAGRDWFTTRMNGWCWIPTNKCKTVCGISSPRLFAPVRLGAPCKPSGGKG